MNTLKNLTNNILIIGCGGIGSWLVDFISNDNYFINKNIYLYDFDVVEENNINRQNFTVNDVRKNKAVALSEKLIKNEFLSIPIYSLDFNIDIDFDVVVIATDNISSRFYYYETIFKCGRVNKYIDVGNDFYTGQLFCLNKSSDINIINLYENFLESSFDNGTCSDNEQNILINKIIARICYLEMINHLNNDFIFIEPYHDNIPNYNLDLNIYYLLNNFILKNEDINTVIENKNNLLKSVYIYENNIFINFYNFTMVDKIKYIMDGYTIDDVFFIELKSMPEILEKNNIYYIKFENFSDYIFDINLSFSNKVSLPKFHKKISVKYLTNDDYYVKYRMMLDVFWFLKGGSNDYRNYWS